MKEAFSQLRFFPYDPSLCQDERKKKVKPNQNNCLYLSIMHISELIHLEVETKFSKRHTLAMFTKEEKGESVSAGNAKTS